MRSVVNKHIDNQKDKKKCSYSTDPEASNVLKISTKKNNKKESDRGNEARDEEERRTTSRKKKKKSSNR